MENAQDLESGGLDGTCIVVKISHHFSHGFLIYIIKIMFSLQGCWELKDQAYVMHADNLNTMLRK